MFICYLKNKDYRKDFTYGPQFEEALKILKNKSKWYSAERHYAILYMKKEHNFVVLFFGAPERT